MNDHKSDRRILKTEKLIQESFIDLSKGKPISEITITEICNKADINRATFYAHYNNRDDLLHKIENNLLNDLEGYLSKFSPSESSDNLRDSIESICNYLQRNKNVFDFLIDKSEESSFRKRLIFIYREQFLSEWLSPTAKDTSDADYIYMFAVSGIVATIQLWIANGMKKPSNEIAQLIMTLVSTGYKIFAANQN